MRISDWSSDVCSSDLAVPGAAAGRAGAAGAAARRRAADRAAGRRRRHSGAAGAVPRCDDLAAPGGAQACRCAWPDGGAGREDAGVSGLAVRHEWSELDEAQRAATLARPARTVSRELRERSEEHTSELQSLMRISYAVFCLKKKKKNTEHVQSCKDLNRNVPPSQHNTI